MIQLAFETSSLPGSLAVLRADAVLAEVDLNPELRTAQSLAPAIADALRQLDLSIRDVRLISCTQGPGSFTGLRVGVTMAKTLAYALEAEVLGVNTLEVIAEQAPPDVEFLSAVIDAQRQQLFELQVRRSGPQRIAVEPTRIIDNHEWLARLAPHVWVTGTGLLRLGPLPAGIRIVDAAAWTPRASTTGRLAWRAYSVGKRADLWGFAPQYFRPSAAEERARNAD